MGVTKQPVSGTVLEKPAIGGDSPVRESSVVSREVPE